MLKHASAPCLTLRQPLEAKEAVVRTYFDEEDPVLKDLRLLFEWIAEKKGAKQISRRQFQERLPEIQRKFPQLVSSFMRLETHGDAVLRWEDFAHFCVQDPRLTRGVRKSNSMAIYGVDRGGNRTPKDTLDPTHLCELGAFAPLLPWEVAHRVEWSLEGVQIGHNRPIAYAVYGGSEVRAGTSFVSPLFQAAGVQGYIRFWPAGYWSKAQQQTRERTAGLLEKFDHPGLSTPPAFNSWCGIAACLPKGSHLVLRFFVGDETSERRECFWSGGAHTDSLWAPTSTKPPQDLRAGAETGGGSIRVGVEILRNLAVQRHTKNMARALPVPMSSELCRAKRPLLLAAPSSAAVPKGATALGGALRAAALNATGSFAKLPSLPPAQRQQLPAVSMLEERWGELRQSTLAPARAAPEVSFSVADQAHVL
mmetsp:Transcript_139636/g.446818  ORF Transcript_139636/g.446818 Transcript_139636/m.446818 type:complete len:423 (-) Transcript_139636:39-1307(-)